MEWLQKIYICILNPFCGISQKINDPTRKRLIYAVVLLLYSTCYIWYSIIGMGHPLTLLSRMIESIFLIIILIFLGLEKPLKPVHWNPIIIGIWFALGVLIFVMGFFTEQNTGYWMTGPVIALGLPCFFMVYGKREKYEMLFDAVCKAAVICSIAYFFVCLAGEFWNDNTWVSGRYNGLTIDANKIGELCLTSFCCIMYYLLVGTSKTWRVLNIIALGMVLGQTYLTQSRTTILAMIFIAGFFYIVLIKNAFPTKNTKKLLQSTVSIILALLLALVCVKGVYALQGVHQEKLQEVLSSEIATEEPVSTENVSENVNDNATKDEYREMLPKEGEDANAFSSGRIHIWQTYAKGFNFIGNSADAATPISPEIYQRTAHNSSVEITYRSGYITGGVYLILVLITGIYLVLIMLRNNEKNSNGDYFIAITAIGYIIFTNLMSSFNPLTASIFLLYVIAFPALLNGSWKTIKNE